MDLLKVEQHSPEWFMARVGACTGSRVRDALATLKRSSQGKGAGESAKPRTDYMLELALGRLTGIVPDHYVTPAMQDGMDREPHACRAYEVVTGNDVFKVGIAQHPRIEYFLSSPDRYVNKDGILEVKCPTPAVHMGYLRANVVPDEYIPQCLSHLACSPERDWCDFMSFHPSPFPAKLQVFIAPRMYRSEWALQIAEIEDGVRKFLAEVAALKTELEAIPGYASKESTRKDAPEDWAEGTYITDADLPKWYTEEVSQ